MKIHAIDARKYTGQSQEIADTEPCPAGWVRCEIDPPHLGAEFVSRTLGWRPAQGETAEEIERKRAALESAYKALIENSICSIQSQTAWLAAFVLQTPCNGTKIMECKAWADRAWAQYHVDKANGLTVPTFSEPQPSYSFLETMTP